MGAVAVMADVALAANPDQHPHEIVRSDRLETAGGTTAAASAWAGYLALVNQCRFQKGLPRLGFVNPHLYRLGLAQQQRQTNSGGIFHDITQGSNGAYQASVGWDAVTGWGSMDGRRLMEALCPGFVSGRCC
jgi:kumamolisin